MRRLVVLVLLAALAGCKRSRAQEQAPSASASVAPAPPPPSRCGEPTEGILLGKGGDEDDPLPSSVQVGSATDTGSGFAVGAVVPTTSGVKAAVILLDEGAKPQATVPLAGAHGDTQPPRVVGEGARVFGALLEASGSVRQLRSFRLDGEELTWGASFDEQRDESLAFDVAKGKDRVLLAWDEDQRSPDRGAIKLVTLGDDLRPKSVPRVVTDKKTDAVSPRLVPREGGFWLAYVALRPEKTDEDARYQAEDPTYRWIEVIPLDGEGMPMGPSKRVTSERGHVLTFDMQTVAGGGLTVVFRDDDTPTGSSGGIMMQVVVRPDGTGEPIVLSDRRLGVGAPEVLPGFVAVADAYAETRLAKLGPDGRLLDALAPEPVLGRGEPLAQRGDGLLVVQFRGPRARLFVTRCDRPIAPNPVTSEPSAPIVPPG